MCGEMQHGRHALEIAQVNAANSHLEELTVSGSNLKEITDKLLRKFDSLTDPTLTPLVHQLVALQQCMINHSNNIEVYTPIIRNTLSNLLTKIQSVITDNIAELRTRIVNLESNMQTMQGILDNMEQELSKSRNKILLGQVAYVIDQVATFYVFGKDCRNIHSISNIRTAARDGDLTVEQVEKWEKFCAFIKRRKWKLYELISSTSTLRKLRFATAHGSIDETKNVTVNDLEKWANELLESSQVSNFTQLLKLSTLFTKSDQPLVHRDDIDNIIEQDQV